MDRKDVEWLLEDLCVELGFSMAVREPDRFVELVERGPEAFSDAVLIAEGLDPRLEKRWRRDLRDFVSARFERWSDRGDA